MQTENAGLTSAYIIAHLCVVVAMYSSTSDAEESKTTTDAPLDIAMSEETFFENIPNVLTVSRLKQPVSDAPSAVTVIDKETIRAAGIIDLPEVFRLVPGFYVGINAGFIQNNNYAVSYHGMNDAYARRMQVLIDGRSVYEPLFGGVQWSELPVAIQDIERIEITRGPNAASYGSNAFLGVINIITQTPNEARGNRISSSIANGRNELLYRYGGSAEDLNYRITAWRREDSGLNNRPDYKRTDMISARANYQLSLRDELEFQFGATTGTMQEGDILGRSPFAPIHDRDIYNHFEMIKWRRTLNDNHDLQIQAYHSLDHSSNQFTSASVNQTIRKISPIAPLAANPFVFINSDIESERYDIEAQDTLVLKDGLRTVFGGSYRVDKTYAPFWLGTPNTAQFEVSRLFNSWEWQLNSWLLLNAGGMLEHNSFTDTDFFSKSKC